MRDNTVIAFICVCFGLFLALTILQAAAGCGREDGSCIQIEDFIAGVEK